MTDDEILTLYTSFKEDSRGWLSLYRQHFTQFVTIILAVLAASLTALHNFAGDKTVLRLVSLGPWFNVVLAIVGMRVCWKYYLRYWEHEIASYKLFDALEMAGELNRRIANKSLCPEDTHLFPSRWRERTSAAEYPDSRRLANARVRSMQSSNFGIMVTLALLAAISAVVGWVMLQ